MSPKEFLKNIDWELLKAQKETLVGFFWPGGKYTHAVDEDAVAHIEGVVNLIDWIQDYAVDKMGIPKATVFNLTKDDEDGE